jgi:signal transduction histidine kinase
MERVRQGRNHRNPSSALRRGMAVFPSSVAFTPPQGRAKGGVSMPIPAKAFALKESGNEGLAFVLNLIERRRAEERLRELESDLAYMNRLSVMGELAASLAHEIAQPIASVTTPVRPRIFWTCSLPSERSQGSARLCRRRGWSSRRHPRPHP